MIELIVVTIITAILAALAIATFGHVIDRSRMEKAKYEMAELGHISRLALAQDTLPATSTWPAGQTYLPDAGVPGLAPSRPLTLFTGKDTFCLASTEAFQGAYIGYENNAVVVAAKAEDICKTFRPADNTGGTGDGGGDVNGGSGHIPAPGAPADLQTTARTADTITLAWTAPAGAVDAYVIHYQAQGDSAWQTATVTDTAVTLTGLTPDTTYLIWAQATNVGGNSPEVTTPLTAATLPATPSAPTNVRLHVDSQTAITVTWDAPSGPVNGYRVTYNVVGSTTKNLLVTSASSLTLNTLTASTNYEIWVTAYNSAGESDPEGPAWATTMSPMPTAPTNVTAQATSQSSITVSWAANTGHVTYNVFWKTAGGTRNSTATTNTTTTITGLLTNTTYEIWVTAYNSTGTSPNEPSKFVTTLPNLPGIPQSVQVAGASTSSLSVTWVAPSGAVSGYLISYAEASSNTWQSFTTTGTSATITGLAEGVTYKVSVATMNAAGTSDAVGPYTAATLTTPPNAPVVSFSNLTTTSFTASWQPVSGATGYTLSYRPVGSSTWTTKELVGNANTTITLTGLTSGINYEVDTVANNPGGTSDADVSFIKTPIPVATLTMTAMSEGFYAVMSTQPITCSATGYSTTGVAYASTGTVATGSSLSVQVPRPKSGTLTFYAYGWKPGRTTCIASGTFTVGPSTAALTKPFASPNTVGP